MQQKDVDACKATWQDYYDTLDDSEKYIIDVIKNTKDLSKLTSDDLVNANLAARESAINYNYSLNQSSISAKAANLAIKGLAIAGNMLASWAISEGIKLLYDCATASDRLKKSASELSETFASDKADIEGYKDTPNCRPSNLPIPFFPVLFPSISANFRTSPRKKSYKLIPIRDSEYDSAVSFILQKIRQEAVSNK